MVDLVLGGDRKGRVGRRAGKGEAAWLAWKTSKVSPWFFPQESVKEQGYLRPQPPALQIVGSEAQPPCKRLPRGGTCFVGKKDREKRSGGVRWWMLQRVWEMLCMFTDPGR